MSSGTPIACVKRSQIRPPVVAMLMQPSEVLNSPVGWLLPACSATSFFHQPARGLEIQHEDMRSQTPSGE
jgi:hypothetical protein